MSRRRRPPTRSGHPPAGHQPQPRPRHPRTRPRNTGGHAIRLGLATIANVGDTAAEQIVAARDTGGPFTSIGDLGRRTSLTQPQLESLATAGVFDQLGPDRRQALWAAGAAARDRPGHLPGIAVGLDAPALPGMSTLEIATADALITGITPPAPTPSNSSAPTSPTSARGEAHEPDPAPCQHRAEHVQPRKAAPIDHQVLAG
ncbi:MAG TPA: helix-hairpin-helix domain-containing protein [Actinophytocola sp.]|nr:helix-hairpin-helix domain-containing protein [Actinophytocola sp.]